MTLHHLFWATFIVFSFTHAAHAGPTLLYDPDKDKVLYAEDIDRPWHPASVTKIMTAYVTFGAIKAGRFKLDSRIPYSTLASKMPASKIGMRVGSTLSIEFALKSLIIKSANDIAVALAEAVGGSHDGFVDEMNATARRLGMTRTKYVNPNGLPSPEQVTTARDLAILTTAIIQEYPEHAQYWTMPSMRVGKRRLRSHNSLLRTFHGADGIKTGFICDAGYNIVASATRDGVRLIAIVLGERTPGRRARLTGSLLEHGFETYAWKIHFGVPNLATLPVANDDRKAVSIRKTIPIRVCGGRRSRSRNVKTRSRQKNTKLQQKKYQNVSSKVKQVAAKAKAP